jgi:hypothetical protein
LSFAGTASSLIEISEEVSDWMKTDSTRASFGPVTDQRWEGFPITNLRGLVIQNRLRSFSIYANSGHLNLTFHSANFKDKQQFFLLREEIIINGFTMP